ncbi:unnamed protein product [Effrenium voratum]|nr:unnamed protein product [Effrenium voratum]
MVQEEKVIISTHMAEKGRERMAEELRAKSERQEREKWQQARVLYERFQAEERAKSRQEQEKLRIEKLQESEKKHHENFKSNNQEKAELLLQAQQKREHDAAKVLESKHKIWKENQKDARCVAAASQRKTEAAEQRRREQQQKVQDSCREQMEVVLQKVDEAERKRMEKRRAKLVQVLEKAARVWPKPPEEEEDSSAEGEMSSDKVTRGPSKESQHESKLQPSNSETKVEPVSPSSKMICYDSKELILANGRAHTDYVRRCAHLQQASYDMMTKKHFKAFLAGATKEDEEPRARRMRSLHAKYILENRDSHHKSTDSKSSGSQTARSPRRRHVPTCGLCERPFPLENLIGSAPTKTLQRIKEKEGRDQPTLNHSSSQASGAQTEVEDRVLPGVRLYDAELPLCAACYHRVRISNSH